jgi:hypothetical protein
VFNRLLEFVWFRHAHYEIVEPCEFRAGDGNLWKFGRRIIATTNDDRHGYCPLKDYPNLYRAFANVKNEAALFEFVKLYGPLTDEGATPSSANPHFTSKVLMMDGRRLFESVMVPGDQIDRCLREATWCAHILRYRANKSARLQELIEKMLVQPSLCQMRIDADPVDGVRMSLEPECLLDAIKLQLLESISKGVNTFECLSCGGWFSKKAGAKFCDEKCKDDYHNARRKKQRGVEFDEL